MRRWRWRLHSCSNIRSIRWSCRSRCRMRCWIRCWHLICLRFRIWLWPWWQHWRHHVGKHHSTRMRHHRRHHVGNHLMHVLWSLPMSHIMRICATTRHDDRMVIRNETKKIEKSNDCQMSAKWMSPIIWQLHRISPIIWQLHWISPIIWQIIHHHFFQSVDHWYFESNVLTPTNRPDSIASVPGLVHGLAELVEHDYTPHINSCSAVTCCVIWCSTLMQSWDTLRHIETHHAKICKKMQKNPKLRQI